MKPIAVAFAVIILEAIVVIILDKLGINPPMWILILIGAICIAVIVWGLMPEKLKDWSREQVGVIWPTYYESLSNKPNRIIRFTKWIRTKIRR